MRHHATIVPVGLGMSRPSGLMAGAKFAAMSRAAEVKGDLHDSRLASNLRRLIEHQCGGSVNAWCARWKLPQSTINKLCRGTRDATVSVLENIGDVTGYAPWQLLHPDFDPVTMPPMMDARAMRVAAIFSGITDQRDRDRAESIMEQFAPADEPARASDTSVQRTRSQ